LRFLFLLHPFAFIEMIAPVSVELTKLKKGCLSKLNDSDQTWLVKV
jgi:hypothetical protein